MRLVFFSVFFLLLLVMSTHHLCDDVSRVGSFAVRPCACTTHHDRVGAIATTDESSSSSNMKRKQDDGHQNRNDGSDSSNIRIGTRNRTKTMKGKIFSDNSNSKRKQIPEGKNDSLGAQAVPVEGKENAGNPRETKKKSLQKKPLVQKWAMSQAPQGSAKMCGFWK